MFDDNAVDWCSRSHRPARLNEAIRYRLGGLSGGDLDGRGVEETPDHRGSRDHFGDALDLLWRQRCLTRVARMFNERADRPFPRVSAGRNKQATTCPEAEVMALIGDAPIEAETVLFECEFFISERRCIPGRP
jgi:hypothetical protein